MYKKTWKTILFRFIWAKSNKLARWAGKKLIKAINESQGNV